MLAAVQWGLVARVQLLELGLDSSAIDRRIRAGRLHPIYPGVYAVGHDRLAREGRWLAAVMACGAGAVLSHRSAAAHWGIRPYSGRIEITARHARRHGRRLVVSRSAIDPDEITEHHGIPTTTPARALLDLGQVLEPHQLDRAIREADYLGLVDFGDVQELLDRYPRRRGSARLRKAIETAIAAQAHTRSDLEDRFRALVLDANLPTPELNATIELDGITIEVDAAWRQERILVELDGWQAHSTRHSFVNDRARDRAAQAAGYVVLRYTWADLDRGSARQIRKLLSERRPPRSGRRRSGAPRA